MAIPLAPIAFTAARYGAVALAAYAVTRRLERGHIKQATEDALDDVAEGIAAHRPKDRQQVNGSVRFKRSVRLGANGLGIEIDMVSLGRIKFRKI